MQLFLDKKGNLSPFRTSLTAGAFGLLVLVISAAGFFIDQESRRTPYFPPVPNGAETWGYPRPGFGPTNQFVYYRIQNSDPAAVAAFYNDQLEELDPQADGARCERFPATGTFADPQYNSLGQRIQVEYNPETQPAYRYACMFDRGGFNTTQWTQVNIYPNLPSFPETEGYTVIEYEQTWSS